MNNKKDIVEFDEIIQTLAEKYGDHILRYDKCFLKKRFDKKAAESNFSSGNLYLKMLLKNPEKTHQFFNFINITYSEFFRNPLTFLLVKNIIFPMLLKSKEKSGDNSIRIWSAGCSAGQEVYSMAIILDEILGEDNKSFAYQIFATDINEDLIATARKGFYGFNDVKNVTMNQITRYFIKHEDGYRLINRIKKNIEFSVYDLNDQNTSCPPESIYGEFDLIMCCNLLFYYNATIQKAMINKINECLPPGGYIITGEAEKSIVEKLSCFLPVLKNCSVFQKIRGAHL